MNCPSCGRHKGKRGCPALGQTICPVCCGTKRLTEIACPAECSYLSASQRHPAAIVQRQQARDVAVLMPTLRHFTERQHQLFFLFQSVIARHQPDSLAQLQDADVAEAAATLAKNLETAARGIIYDQHPQSAVAAGLAREMRLVLEEVRKHGNPVGDLEVAAVLRAIEQGATGTGDYRVTDTTSRTAYLDLMARLLQVKRAAGASPASTRASSLITP